MKNFLIGIMVGVIGHALCQEIAFEAWLKRICEGVKKPEEEHEHD